ncbi:MAG: cupredoxin domain-containing protein [Candidatus Levyibacteriota bacterium]
MDKKLLYVTIIVLLLIGAIYFAINKGVSSPTKKDSGANLNTKSTEIQEVVTVTKNGFDPKDLSVKAGTRVIWTNKSGGPATVNSDNHPDHLLFPFLNLGEFGDESSVQVIFDKSGKYPYHNHLAPSQTGTVTVE